MRRHAGTDHLLGRGPSVVTTNAPLPTPNVCYSGSMEHGTNSTYVNHKCRCVPCVEAHRVATAAWRASRVEAGLTQRGTPRRVRTKAERQANPTYQRRARLKAYGLTEESWQAMWDAQGGKCGAGDHDLVAGRETHVDHSHETGKVRGLLCSNCNRALGLLKDNPARVQGLLNYITGSPMSDTWA